MRLSHETVSVLSSLIGILLLVPFLGKTLHTDGYLIRFRRPKGVLKLSALEFTLSFATQGGKVGSGRAIDT